MKIKNGYKIAFANKKLCNKVLIYKISVWLVFSIVLFLSSFKTLSVIIKSNELREIVNLFLDTVKKIITFDEFDGAQIGNSFEVATKNFLNFISSISVKVTVVLIVYVVLNVVRSFFISLCDYIIAVNTNEHMSSMRHAGFFNTFWENLSKSVKFSLFKSLSLFVCNLLMVTVLIFIFLKTIKILSIFTLSFILLLSLIVVALRLTFTGMILPKMVCEGKGVFKSFVECFKEIKMSIFLERFFSYFYLCFISYVITVASAIFTLFVSLLITIPIFSVMFIALRFVDYYEINLKKFYCTFDEIVIPKELRKNDENLLNEIDI